MQFSHHKSRSHASKCEQDVKVFNNFVENRVEMDRSRIENPLHCKRKSSLHNSGATAHAKIIPLAGRAFYKRNNSAAEHFALEQKKIGGMFSTTESEVVA